MTPFGKAFDNLIKFNTLKIPTTLNEKTFNESFDNCGPNRLNIEKQKFSAKVLTIFGLTK
jgi:hypothetical protein